MLNILKYDFYKLTHSKKLKIFYIVAIAVLFVVDSISYISTGSNTYSVLSFMRFSYTTICCCSLVFFVPLFIGEDFSSGYIKNIYTNTSKICYVFSKLIYIIAFCVAMWLAEFIVFSLYVFIFGGKCFVSESDYKYYVYYKYKEECCAAFLTEIFSMFGIKLLGFIAVGTIMMFFTVLFKNDIIVACVGFAYSFFLSGVITNFLNDKTGVRFEYFLPFGTTQITMMIIWQNMLGGSLTLIGFSVLFAVFTWLIIKDRRV